MRPDYKEQDKTKTYLITRAMGFIGYFLAKQLLEQGCSGDRYCIDGPHIQSS